MDDDDIYGSILNEPKSTNGGTKINTETQNSSGPSSSLFISNMTWWTSDEDIRAALDELSGRVKEIQFIEHKPNGKSKGMAVIEFVDVATAEAAKACLEGKMIHGRICEVSFSRNAPIKPYERASMNRNDVSRTRYPNYNQSSTHHQGQAYQDDDYETRSNASSNSSSHGRYSGDRRGRGDYDRSRSPDRRYSSSAASSSSGNRSRSDHHGSSRY